MSADVTARWLSELCAAVGIEVVESADLPAESPRFTPVPAALDIAIRRQLRSAFPGGLYSHQSDAIQAALGGADVCLATSTASGKSLVFMAYAAHLVATEPASKVLALYPARALIQDQLDKWRAFLEPLGTQPGYIDGGVPIEQRSAILRSARVVLMTPDVAHAWLMSNLNSRDVHRFLGGIRLLVLDEAHVYDGVFGTNMAYFLRRLEVACTGYRLVCSTATLGLPADFTYLLTGRHLRCFGPEDDGSGTPEKTVLLARNPGESSFDATADLLARLAEAGRGKFLAFGDSRKMVELLVAAAHRTENVGLEVSDESDNPPGGADSLRKLGVLPYRAGYETEDRNAIQRALSTGVLSGVVSTSALELGIDIGAIDLAVLLTTPPSVKAFWQRLGRVGRRRKGLCLLIDGRGTVADSKTGLSGYLRRPVEPNWLYLENRYIQYTNALCAASELGDLGMGTAELEPFRTVPPTFREFVENELNPAETVPPDLYEFKQKAQAGPHREFPIRSGIEPSFQIRSSDSALGTVTLSQALREAYPGAVYYYMARPYRVRTFRYKTGEITVGRERYFTTRPLLQAMVFPRFQGGLLQLWRSDEGFLTECEMQVSERVLGFVEQRGSVKEEFLYGPSSAYSQRPLSRFFVTTGVCWYFGNARLSEAAASRILEAFCSEFGVQERDLGVGAFHAKCSPVGAEQCQGVCVFDSTNGSLRLTQRLAENFQQVLEAAMVLAEAQDDLTIVDELRTIEQGCAQLRQSMVDTSVGGGEPDKNDWVVVIAPGQAAVFLSDNGAKEVKVLGYRYTPKGLLYELEPDRPGVDRWAVLADFVQPLHGETRLVRANLVTGEVEEIA